MSDDEMRVAILEKMGWKREPFYDEHLSNGETILHFRFNDTGIVRPFNNSPDYLTDLNAMHEAEKVLTDLEYAKFSLYLGPLTSQRIRDYISATARQRAEAFCRTLWPERFNH